MTFYNDKLLLSHSFGILPSRVVFYEKSDKRLYVDENSAVSYRFPERIEQIFVDGDDLYVLFESAESEEVYKTSGTDLFYRWLWNLSGKNAPYETAFVFMKEDYQDIDVPPWAIRLILDEEDLESV